MTGPKADNSLLEQLQAEEELIKKNQEKIRAEKAERGELDIEDKAEEIKKHNIESRYRSIQENHEAKQKLGNLSLKRDPSKIQQMVEANDRYLKNASEKSMTFINKDFDGRVPYQAQQVILVGGKSGQGKSTSVANLGFHALTQGHKVLIISNEEIGTDVYNRHTCLMRGWHYVNHSEFTDEQRSVFNEYIEKLSQRLTVVDDDYLGETEATGTLEYVQEVLEKARDEDYDLILIDYYQNISRSLEFPYENTYQIQERFSKWLDNYKKTSNCPIVLMAQIKEDSEGKMTFKDRLEGRKVIYNVSTCALEARVHYDKQATEFYIAKSRFESANNTSVMVGYLKGRYVQYSDEFRKKVAVKRNQEKDKELLSHVFKGDELDEQIQEDA